MKETVCEVRWQGPTAWAERESLRNPGHMLYAIYGVHHLYGANVLLYLGMTESTVADRLCGHSWIGGEYDPVTIKVASIGVHAGIDEWWQAWDKTPDDHIYPRAPVDVIRAVETLLIYAHQPAYNTQGKGNLPHQKLFRVFNTGRCGELLPEVSHAYFAE
jgi:hypothetical protein